MDGPRCLRPHAQLLARAVARPATTARRGRLGSKTPVRRKSGPYGYTQAKALVYSRHGEPADALKLHTHSISPSIPSSSVLVRTLAAPINPADINTVQGTYGAKQPLTSLIGTAEPSAVPGTGRPRQRQPVLRAGLGMRPLDVGSGQWFIQNGANSGVGRAAIQFGRLWGLRSINVVRDRETTAETDALKRELVALGANVVVTESQFLSREWRDRLADITRGGREQVGLGLNCVGGKSATALARSLGDGAAMVSYGGMARQPVALPVGLLIFNDIRFVGFWLSRWNQQDPTGRRHMVDDILSLIRDGKFKDVPVEEIKWDWDTQEATLRDAVQNGLQGFRKGKGLFVFGDT
ncbi:hypothetical protein HIM_04776 [Hirsutella minnesotensis 3608]|uniref:Alcohol dehydrogenase-like C-terminal domain-containing protein n=1 Tax=Hirsutella minnesotensis 3608 TaxID=1043627 RepID=A0A0F8A172_9HYPO|nr:hypothetical protein HIM_04776 [Hirsutella minnesotensis 3608]